MAGGFGLSRMMSGAVDGLNKVEARRDRETAREDRSVQRDRETIRFDQGQDDREYALNRRSIETGRLDKEYERAEGNRQRKIKVNDALKSWMVDGNLDGVNSVANEFGREGVTHNLTKNDDGSYTMKYTGESGKESSENITEEDVGQRLMMLNDDDFAASLRGQAAKASERKFDMAKLNEEYRLKRGLEHVKGSYKKMGGSGSESADKKAIVADNKEQADLSKEYYGNNYNGMFSFDTKSKKRMSSTHTQLAGAYRMSNDTDTNDAQRYAARAMAQLEDQAIQQADIDLDNGDIDKKDYERRVSDLVDSYADVVINRMAPKPGETLSRRGDAGGDTMAAPAENERGVRPAAQAGDQPGGPASATWETFLENVKKTAPADMSPAEVEKTARKYFERVQKMDSTDSGIGQADEPVSDSSLSIPGISDASASEEKNTLDRTQDNEKKAAAAEKLRKREQQSGVSDEALSRVKKKRTAEVNEEKEAATLGRGKKKAASEQKKYLRRYRKLKNSARAKIMSKKELGLALLAAESKEEKDDIKRLLKGKSDNAKR